MFLPYVPHVRILVAASTVAAKLVGGKGARALCRSTRNPFINWRVLCSSVFIRRKQYLARRLNFVVYCATVIPSCFNCWNSSSGRSLSQRGYLIKILTLLGKTSTKVSPASLGLGLNRGSRKPSVETRALIPPVIPRTPSLGQLRRSKVSAFNRQSSEPETGSSDKFRHPVVNTSLNSKHSVTSPGVLTRPPCATLAGEPLLIQPARK
ncbi:hypothetical protein M9H77_18188 [Catharanthus roseus]|uniref:Uncharacterized protein n=1 Tax=Catharanthus roseus TaxID=4058 RepID=A0ACC0B6R2_CATRO|nr:hypothetical protein M9H77_18188 [Catharanthus roseus]